MRDKKRIYDTALLITGIIISIHLIAGVVLLVFMAQLDWLVIWMPLLLVFSVIGNIVANLSDKEEKKIKKIRYNSSKPINHSVKKEYTHRMKDNCQEEEAHREQNAHRNNGPGEGIYGKDWNGYSDPYDFPTEGYDDKGW